MNNAKLLHKYKNGNVNVEIYDDGTKIREWPDGEAPVAEYPESCDLKITQFCDMDAVCVYCHEMSNRQGKHGDLEIVDSVWASQMPGTELAIGGGNPLAHPNLIPFLRRMKARGIIANVTVNIMHVKKFADMIVQLQEEELVHGLGISYRGPKSLNLLPDGIDYKNVVFHMILGIHDLNDCTSVVKWCSDRDITPKMLLLGYKTYGNGKNHYTPELRNTLELWKNILLPALLNCGHDGLVVSFDNLAIEQLELKNQLSAEDWSALFQGEDSTHTFYIDAVKQEVAGTSTSSKRFPIKRGEHIVDVFNKVKVAA